MPAQRQRRGFDPDQGVVLLVLQRVDRVVADHPEDRAAPEQQGRQLDPPVTAGQPTRAAQEKTRPSQACGHQVIRFMNG